MRIPTESSITPGSYRKPTCAWDGRSRSSRTGFRASSWSFFFSSRRRHTRCLSDWSSDVCSSDLDQCETEREQAQRVNADAPRLLAEACRGRALLVHVSTDFVFDGEATRPIPEARSEERRVGQECRCGWSSQSDIKLEVIDSIGAT